MLAGFPDDDETSHDTYLERLGITYPTVRETTEEQNEEE